MTTLGPFVGASHLICGTSLNALLRLYCLYKLIGQGKASISWHTITTKTAYANLGRLGLSKESFGHQRVLRFIIHSDGCDNECSLNSSVRYALDDVQVHSQVAILNLVLFTR